jgi:hypothetical protein
MQVHFEWFRQDRLDRIADAPVEGQERSEQPRRHV